MTLEEFKSRLTESAQEAEHAVEAMAEMGGSSEEFARWEGRSDAFSQVLGWTEQLATLTAKVSSLEEERDRLKEETELAGDSLRCSMDAHVKCQQRNAVLVDAAKAAKSRLGYEIDLCPCDAFKPCPECAMRQTVIDDIEVLVRQAMNGKESA